MSSSSTPTSPSAFANKCFLLAEKERKYFSGDRGESDGDGCNNDGGGCRDEEVDVDVDGGGGDNNVLVDDDASFAIALVSGLFWLLLLWVIGAATKALLCRRKGPTACSGRACEKGDVDRKRVI